jgi:enolase-phosphatase E1
LANASIRGILLDIEGTTSSVSFVYDVMFPFVRRELDRYLATHSGDTRLLEAVDVIARDLGHDSFADWARSEGVTDEFGRHMLLRREVLRLMDGDVKATGLKHLQGLIWEEGFQSGELKAHVYDDVPPALRKWRGSNFDVRIYSSGSIQAQKLFFGHTIAGDLLPLLRGHYDTTTGPKKEAASYRQIAGDFAMEEDQILFVSDVVAELDAARSAGMKTALAVRPGNAAVSAEHGHAEIRSFDQIEL